MTIERLGGEGSGASGSIPYSRAVRAGDFVYLSGQVGFDENGDVGATYGRWTIKEGKITDYK